MAGGNIYIPVQNTDEQVEIDVANLPDHNDVLDLLKAEQAPLDLWLTLAREYFKQGKVNEFLDVLNEGSSPEVEEFYSKVKYERMAILNALGAYYTGQGRIHRRQRLEFLSQAIGFYNKAAKIDNLEATTWIGKGQLQIAKGELEAAAEMFKIVLTANPNSVPALLGQACVQFNKGRFVESLALYKRVLQLHPRCPPAVRLGIGLCHFRLQNSVKSRAEFHAAKARQAFERVLQLDPENAEALVALGMIDINKGDVEDVKLGLQRMRSAYEIYPYGSMALNQLANHFFFAGRHAEVEQLMEASLAATDHPLMRAESRYILGRTHHAQGRYDKAARYYRAATQDISNPADFILPFYGLGQIHLKLGDLKAALACLEKVLQVQPSNPEALKVVGCIYTQQGQFDLALQNFRKVTDLDPTDIDAWMEVGELLVNSDFGAALEALNKARQLLQKDSRAVPAELLSNIAVLETQRGLLQDAEKTYLEALGPGSWNTLIGSPNIRGGPSILPAENMIARPDSESLIPGTQSGSKEVEMKEPVAVEKVTILYNLAMLYEKMHDSGRAAALHHLILKQYPGYFDCYLRLAAMAKARQDLSSSLDLVGQALGLAPDNVDALLMRAALEAKMEDMPKAKLSLKKILESQSSDVAYVLLALGNWNLAMSARPSKDPKAESIYLEKARECFHKVLSQNSSNMYAASGMACVVGEKGMFDIAKDIFTQVVEAATSNEAVDMRDILANLAHVHLAKGDYPIAVKMYQKCQDRFYQGHAAKVLMWQARAHYEAEQWPSARRALQKALHLAPPNHMLRFDAAVTMQKLAMLTLKMDPASRTADQVRMSVAELKNALRLFSQLAALGTQHAHGFDSKKIETHTDYCQHLLEAAKTHLELAERKEQQLLQQREVLRQQAAAEGARRRALEERRLQEERERREALKKKLAEEEEEIRRRRESWRKVEKVEEDMDVGDGSGAKARSRKDKKKKKKGKRSRDGNEEEAEYQERGAYEDDAEGDEDMRPMARSSREGTPIAPRRHRKRELGRRGADAGEDLLAATGLLDDSDVESQGAAMDSEKPSSKRRRRGRAVSDSDEDEGEVSPRGGNVTPTAPEEVERGEIISSTDNAPGGSQPGADAEGDQGAEPDLMKDALRSTGLGDSDSDSDG